MFIVAYSFSHLSNRYILINAMTLQLNTLKINSISKIIFFETKLVGES